MSTPSGILTFTTAGVSHLDMEEALGRALREAHERGLRGEPLLPKRKVKLKLRRNT